MPPAFTLGHVIGPVATATVLNVFAFAMLWQGHRTELRTGVLPWRLWAVFPLYGLPLLAFLYLTGERPITTPLQIFGAAMVGEVLGGVAVYMLLNTFLWSRGQPIRERIAPMIGCLFLMGVMFAALLS